mmetsp:Transcript_20777/g.34802  ORF Transcript_20777/g.34802 Transcript_20777/m.34802 type:complete len:160 (-) Transcript_20777:18-497(-)
MAIMKTVHKEVIRQSFQRAGIYPFDLNIIFGHLKSDITQDEIVNIVTHMKPLVKLMSDQGELYEADYTRFGIRPGLREREFVQLCSKRGVILTNRKHIKRRKDEADAKEEADIEREVKKRRKQEQARERKEEKEKAQSEQLVLRIPKPSTSSSSSRSVK